VRPNKLVGRTGGTRDLPGGEELARLPDCERDRRLVHRDVDKLSAAVTLADAQRREDADRRVEASGEVGDRHADLHRRPTLLTRHAHQTAHRLDDDVECRPLGVWPVETPSRHCRVDEPWIRVEKALWVEAEVAHRARPEVLDDDVGALRETTEDVCAGPVFEIERDAALAAIEPHKVAALAVDDGLEAAR